MKGAMGLTIAAGLGIVGAVCNWLYLQQLAREQETVDLIGVRNGAQINIGDTFKESDLEAVPIPRAGAEALISLPANHVFYGGEIIVNDDLVGPAVRDLAETLQEDEVARWVPIDSRSVVTEQINPGDLVSFEVPRGALAPTPVTAPDAPGDTAPAANPPAVSPPGAWRSAEFIGPFRVLALGPRREPAHVAEAARGRGAANASTITIVVKLIDGKLEPNAARLFEALRLSGSQGVGVMLHSSRRGS
jgi:hypothetical protein